MSVDPQILRSLVQTEFLTTKELGRLLLCTSKYITHLFEEDEDPKCITLEDASLADAAGLDGGQTHEDDGNSLIWKLICKSHWENVQTAEILQKATNMSWRNLFFVLAGGCYSLQERYHSLFPALRYNPADYTLILEGRGANQQLLFCETIHGQDYPDFFASGSCTIELSKPFGVDQMEHTDKESPARLAQYLGSLNPDSLRVCLEQGRHSLPPDLPFAPVWYTEIHLVRTESNGRRRVLPFGTEYWKMSFVECVSAFEAKVLRLDSKDLCLSQFSYSWMEGLKQSRLMRKLGRELHLQVDLALQFTFTLEIGDDSSAKQDHAGRCMIRRVDLRCLFWDQEEEEALAVDRMSPGSNLQFAHFLEAIMEEYEYV